MTTPYLNTWNQANDLNHKWVDGFSNREQWTKEMTQAWMENLKGSTMDSSISKVSTKSDLMVQETWLRYEKNIHTLVWFLSAADELLWLIEDTKMWISKKWLSKAGKETMKNAKEKLKQYEKQLKGKREALLKQERVEIYENDIANLKNLWQQVNEVRADIWMWQWWELSNNASFLYNSPENAKLANRKQTDMLKFNQNLQQEVKQWAILNIFNWNIQKATDFYRRIAEWQYTKADYEFFTSNTSILTPSLQRCWIYVPLLAPDQLPVSWWSQVEQRNSVGDYSNMDWWETFQKWWVAWCLDKVLSNFSNMSPWQRNAWKSLGVLWGVAAWIFWLYKFYTNKKMWFRGKAWITAATIFGSQALTWEWPISLFNKLLTWWFSKSYLESKFWNSFGNAVNWLWNSWIESSKTITPAMYSMMVFNPKTTIWNIDTMTYQFKTDPNARRVFRWEAINKLKNKYWTQSSEYFSATFSDKFDEEKRNNRLASFWITDLSKESQKDIPVYEVANNATMNEIVLEKYKSEHGVKETSNEVKRKEFEEYVENYRKNNQPIDEKDLDTHPEWFDLDKDATYTERPVDIHFKETFEKQIETFGLDELKKSELKMAIKRFYDERTIDSKPITSDFSLKMENGLLVLTSHNWQATKIDVSKNGVVGFWNGIRFADFSELLNAADLTNKILDSQKWSVPISYPPFQYKLERWWIYFNSAKWRRFKGAWDYLVNRNYDSLDTKVLSAWPWGASKKIEPIDDHLKEYAEYLTKRWMETHNPTPK